MCKCGKCPNCGEKFLIISNRYYNDWGDLVYVSCSCAKCDYDWTVCDGD